LSIFIGFIINFIIIRFNEIFISSIFGFKQNLGLEHERLTILIIEWVNEYNEKLDWFGWKKGGKYLIKFGWYEINGWVIDGLIKFKIKC